MIRRALARIVADGIALDRRRQADRARADHLVADHVARQVAANTHHGPGRPLRFLAAARPARDTDGGEPS